MPYGDQYTSGEMAIDVSPYSYAYRPSYGWLWLEAPWVSGLGSYPYFGSLGPSGFGWYRGLYHEGYGWGGYRGGDHGVGGDNQAGNGGGGHRAAPSPAAAGGSRGGDSGGNRTVRGLRGGVNSGAQGNSGSRRGLGGRGGGGRR